MHLKIITAQFFIVSCLLFSAMVSVNARSCFECEEEVWEEVPCDEVPSNNTTNAPPPCHQTPPACVIPSTPTPETSTEATTISTDSTTTSSTSMVTADIETSTPPTTETTTPNYDVFKKCYCECKSGCKEFCHKVVHPGNKNHIVQVSEISEPVPQGRIESTHYHHRKLIPAPTYHSSPPVYSHAHSSSYNIPTQMEVKKPLEDYPTIYNTIQSYYKSPVIAPHYTYAHARAGSDSLKPDLSYVNKHQTFYFSSSPSEIHDLPRYFHSLHSQEMNNHDRGSYKHSYASSPTASFSSPVTIKNSEGLDEYYDPNFYNHNSYDNYRTYSDSPNYSISYSR
ncbi:uncharacterized protein LOC106081140 [Stomoxys calcitrans]|uniref:Uncharacterized protein n=1 Tax=Stomoxys calcitrans TaxID=35570 RepID=A0A1I8P5Y9_STOCA|nr:uncharacterized protein LOC106081140 [Stomoxys calcitrans]